MVNGKFNTLQDDETSVFLCELEAFWLSKIWDWDWRFFTGKTKRKSTKFKAETFRATTKRIKSFSSHHFPMFHCFPSTSIFETCLSSFVKNWDSETENCSKTRLRELWNLTNFAWEVFWNDYLSPLLNKSAERIQPDCRLSPLQWQQKGESFMKRTTFT